MPLGEEIPSNKGIKEGYPLRNRYFTTIGSSSMTTVADRHRLAAYHNKHCRRAFQWYQHRWPWTTNEENVVQKYSYTTQISWFSCWVILLWLTLYTTYIHMHTNVTRTNKRCTHAQSNYTNTKPKAWFRRLLHHPARKREWAYYTPWTHMGDGYRAGTLYSVPCLLCYLPAFVGTLCI